MHDDEPGGPIRWKLHLPGVPVERVYATLDGDAGRAAFWAESAVERDGTIAFEFVDGTRVAARVLERRPPALWSIEYFGARVRFELAPDGAGGTDLTLATEGADDAPWHEIHAGWLNVLFPLKARLVHGVELRNRDPERTWDRGWADG